MSTVKINQKNSNDISTSINILNEKEEDEIHNEISISPNILKVDNSEINNKNKKNENDNDNEKDDKITIEYLTNIISQPDEQEEEQEKDNEKEHNQEEEINKREKNSQDDLIKKNIMKKQKLNKYILVNPQFKTTSSESEEESNHNDLHSIKPTKYKLYKFVGRTLFVFLDKYENPLIIMDTN